MDLHVYSRRQGHEDVYKINKTDTGWYVNNLMMKKGDCDKRGAPILFESLDHDSINYPHSLGDYLEWLWDQAYDTSMSEEEIQENLNLLGEWINATEKSSPKGIFTVFK